MFVKLSPNWTAKHSASIRLPSIFDSSSGLVFSDTPAVDWHLMVASDPAFVNRHLNLKIAAQPAPSCDTQIYINHEGGNDVLIVSASGEIVGGAYKKKANVTRNGSGSILIDLTYYSNSPEILIGTAKNGKGEYQGNGEPQYAFLNISVSVAAPGEGEKLVLVDVGAAGGLPPSWTPHLNDLHCVFFEPFPGEASKIAYPSSQVFEAALSDRTGSSTLNVTRFPYCSSLQTPNPEVLERYSVSSCFDVVKTVPISCSRYDEIAGAPKPDMIKIDVQGFEYEVLQGFGSYLDTVIGIELESHFYPIYKNQKLVHDLVGMMAERGLRLNALRPVMSFNRDLVEVNLFFTRSEGLPEGDLWKLDRIRQALDLTFTDWIGVTLEKMFPR